MAWVNKVAMFGYTWLFVYESARRYEGRMNVAPGLGQNSKEVTESLESGTRTNSDLLREWFRV